MASERLCFVQFIHPGGEHGPDSGDRKSWNLGAHKRKFLWQRGLYVDNEGEVHEDDVLFWGEWEPDSRVRPVENRVQDGPKFVHEPFLPRQSPDGWRQNTDPFVFGDQFHYTGCLQHTRRGPTRLRYLARGSVLLFGSAIERSKFVLDTVMVIERWVDHSRRDFEALATKVSDTYWAATIEPWYSGAGGDEQSYRLYSGATYESPLNGMFSFFPCTTSASDPNGFARPEIRLPGLVTPTLTQGKRLNRGVTAPEVQASWAEVARQVQAQGLSLGVYAELPTRAPTT
jgi:hypothetical protein